MGAPLTCAAAHPCAMKTPPPYEETIHHPLTTRGEILERVDDLVGTAVARQLWLLFVDEDDVQLPILVPLDHIPVRPSDRERRSIEFLIDSVCAECDWAGTPVAGVIVVHERYASPQLQNADREWARTVRDVVVDSGLAFRAAAISHSSGTRLLEPNEIEAG